MATEKTSPGPLDARAETTRDSFSLPDAPERIRLLWLGIDNVSFKDAADRIVQMCRRRVPSYVTTPNVDHFMRARRDVAFRDICENADLTLADGMPVLWASRALGRPLKEKVSGSDLFVKLCDRATDEGLRVFLLGGSPGVAEQAKHVLQSRHPGLEIVGTYSPVISPEGENLDAGLPLAIIRDAQPHLLFVAFGCPKQEKWIARHYRMLGVPVSIGVGASFDFVAGTQRRAPEWMQRKGLEWLWRLMHEPRRLWKRYLIEDLPFLWQVAREKMVLTLRRNGR